MLLFCYSYSSADPPINELTISDDGYAEVPLDFDFPFFGNTYSKSWMYSNGVVGFLNPSTLSGTPRHMCCNGMDLNEISNELDIPLNQLEKELQVVAESLGIQISENLQPSVGVAFLDHCVNLYNQSSAQ